MKLIDKIIKILITFKYKREPFMTWSWGIDNIHEINILTTEYYQDHYKYGTREEWYNEENKNIDFEEDWKIKSFDHEGFYNFLLNTIQPNEMEKYRNIFLSSGEIVN